MPDSNQVVDPSLLLAERLGSHCRAHSLRLTADTTRLSDPGGTLTSMPLTDQHRAILDFETTHQHWKFAAAKETAIREKFQMSATRYYMTLNWLLEQPEALEYAPGTVRRLARLRDARREARGSGGGRE